MRYPRMNTQRNAMVSVPQLDGGVNLCDMHHAIADNQLAACDNVWWLDGALRTRPALKKGENIPRGHSVKQVISEREMLLMCFSRLSTGSTVDGELISTYGFYAANLSVDGGYVEIGDRNDAYTVTASAVNAPTVFGLRAPKNAEAAWYFFLSTGAVIARTKAGEWQEVSPYAPMLMMNGQGSVDSEEQADNPNAVTFEARNMLTRQIRATYTTDGKGRTFLLPDLPLGNRKLLVELTLYNTKTHETELFTLDYESDTDEAGHRIQVTTPQAMGFTAAEIEEKGFADDDTFYIEFTYNHVWRRVWTKVVRVPASGAADNVRYDIPASSNNNLVLTVSTTDKSTDITKMRRCVWFGGDASGLAGGVHLFVAGHPDKPNLLRWSDLNDALYFPETNYAYVGEDSSAITALAKQGELLVIFREHDIYCMQYIEGSVPSAEEYMEAGYTDITAHKAYFPLTQLHPNIGCDCPDTVRLVNNKLVWMNSDGRVYALVTSNQYSERNVRDISPLIRPALLEHGAETLKKAVAGEYNGYYILLVGNKMYLLDVQTSAFNSLQYYSREEAAQKSLPWYVWTLPQGVYGGMVSYGNDLVITGEYETGEGSGEAVYTDSVLCSFSRDCVKDFDTFPIHSSFTTKQFELGRMDRRRSIGQLYMRLGIRNGGAAEVTYITDAYSRSDPYLLVSAEDVDERDPKFVKTHRLTPNIHRVQSFGVQVDSDDRMAVEGITIQHKNEGVIR